MPRKNNNGIYRQNISGKTIRTGNVLTVISQNTRIQKILNKELRSQNEKLIKSQQELAKLNRILKALKNSGQAMMRASNEKDYLKEVCKILDKDCGYAMVWIGYAEDDEQRSVRPVAWAGFEKGYLETLKLTWADTERGRGPTGTAIRTGKTSLCRNMLTDPKFIPWRKEALKRGYVSSIALPLFSENKILGALTIYSKKPDPFTEDEVNLLSELADDLSQGITILRNRDDRQKAEDELKKMESLLSEGQKIAHLGIFEYIADTKETLWSEEEYRIYGLDSSKPSPQYNVMLEKSIHPDDADLLDKTFKTAIKNRTIYELEHRIVRPDGTVRWVYDRAHPYLEKNGKITRYVGATLDITERKQAEEAVSRSQQTFYELVERAPFGIYIVDSQFRIAHMNIGSQNGAFKNVRPIIGRPFNEAMNILWPDDVAEEIISHFRYTLDTGEPYFSPQFINPRHDADIVESYEWELHRIIMADGQYGVICYYFDSTKLRQAEEEIATKSAIMTAINNIFKEAISSGTKEQLGEKCLAIAEEITQSRFGFIGEINENGLEDIAVSNPGWEACIKLYPDGHRKPPGNFKIHGLYGKVIREGKSFFTNDPAGHSESIGLPKGHPPLESFLGVPLVYNEKVSGIIAVGNRPGGYTVEQQDVLESIAPAIAESLIRKHTEESLRKSEERFKAIASSTPDHILVQSSNLQYEVIINPQMGLTEKDMLGKTDFDFLAKEDAEKLIKIKKQVLETGKPIHMEVPLLNSKGQREFFNGSYVPRFDAHGLVDGLIGYFQNVTERIHSEEQLKLSSEDLKRSNDDLELFAFTASHDLREPLRAINGFIELLRKVYGHKLDEKGLEYIQYAIESTKRMDDLLTGLLNYSRIQTQGKPFMPVSLKDALDNVIANLKRSIDETQAIITNDKLPTVNADESQLILLFQNLISNAIKFHGSQKPQIHIGCKKQKDFWQFSVLDNGIGIDKQYFDRIFMIFQRLHTRDKYPGYGIGLSICKRIVERHGGKIWLDSKLDRGSTFYFTIPA